MCVVSMVMDHYHDKWNQLVNQTATKVNLEPAITDAEIREFRSLLERAREYDRKNNEPNCELEEKREKVKKLAEELGVEIDFL